MRHHAHTMELSATCMDNIANKDIATSFQKQAQMEHQQFLWGLSMQHCNLLYYIIPTSSY